jgi:multisubunit Na+/H+ antiporter MnhG subunit
VSVRDVVALVVLVAGCGLELIALLGVCVMRDALDRLHYVGLAGYGALLVAIAILVRKSFSVIADQSLLVGFLLAFSGSVVVHVTMRSLLIRATGDWRASAPDEAPRG